MSTPERIAQFEKMASADPTNEMAHFSLGNAYLQVGRHAEAAGSLERCLELNPGMSKAYQLCGQAMIGAGWADKATEVLQRGWRAAAARGDRMPQQAMAELLRSIGRDAPEAAAAPEATSAEPVPEGAFICHRTGRPGTKMGAPPFRGAVGLWVQEHISSESWKAWIAQGTKVINELRLDFSRDRDQEVYDQHMRDYLGLDPESYAKLTQAQQQQQQ